MRKTKGIFFCGGRCEDSAESLKAAGGSGRADLPSFDEENNITPCDMMLE
jgi:hypothetical protein